MYTHIYIDMCICIYTHICNIMYVYCIFGTCVGLWFHRGGFKILDFAQRNMANNTVVTQTQLAITCVVETNPFETTPYANPKSLL